MSGKLTIQELEEKLIERTGISRKLAVEWLHTFPAVIEESLISDGEARVRGLGTFKLRWTERRLGRNLRTGEPMEIPAHNRVVFTPESKLRDRVNEDFKFLSYRVIEDSGQQETVSSRQSSVISDIPVASSQPPTANGQRPTANGDQPIPPSPGTQRKRIHWLYPLVFFILVILAVVFYFRNCRGPLVFPLKEKSEQEFRPAETSPPTGEPAVAPDTVSSQQPALKVLPEGSAVSGGASKASGVPTGQDQQPAVSSEAEQSPELTGSAVSGQQPTEIITQGTWLFQLAREQYGNPFLWTLIFAENRDRLRDPQNVPDGISLTIPSLEGTGKKLSRNDSLRVAEGYRLVTEYYLSKGETARVEEYRQGISRYNPR